jgi:hypothetical protein
MKVSIVAPPIFQAGLLVGGLGETGAGMLMGQGYRGEIPPDRHP